MNKIIKIACTIGVVFFALWYFYFCHVMSVSECVNSKEKMTDLMVEAILNNKSTVKFESSVTPGEFDYDEILAKVLEVDTYAGCEFYGFQYQYIIDSKEISHVKIKIKKPRAYRRREVKKRVEKIAEIYQGLDDYEKVKAVHDYIVTQNHYNFLEGGAYEGLCKGSSACNGYALSFYAFMKQMNIPVKNVSGANHIWNMVQLDGKWYNIDLTWDDPGDNRVHYEYFLKCDADWEGHACGGADATVSLPVKGRSAEEYCQMIPNFKLQESLMMIVIVALCVAAFVIFVKVSNENYRKKQFLKMQVEERNSQMYFDMNRLDKELEALDLEMDYYKNNHK